MISGINDLRQFTRSCPINFVRLGLSFTALWAAHLKPEIHKPRVLARQFSLFKLCLNEFRTIFYTLARRSENRKWSAAWRKLARGAVAAARKQFAADPTIGTPAEFAPHGQRWFEAVAGTEWPRGWGDAAGFALTPHLENLFEIVRELHHCAAAERSENGVAAAPDLGALLGIFILQEAGGRLSARGDEDLRSACDVLKGIQWHVAHLDLDFQLPEVSAWGDLENARGQIALFVPELPQFKRAHTAGPKSAAVIVESKTRRHATAKTKSSAGDKTKLSPADSTPGKKLTHLQAWPFKNNKAPLAKVAETLSQALKQIGVSRDVRTIKEWSRGYRWSEGLRRSNDRARQVKKEYVFKTLRQRGYLR
jgi:hypothetical protein